MLWHDTIHKAPMHILSVFSTKACKSFKEKYWNGDFSKAILEGMDLTSGQQCRVQVKRALRLGVWAQGSLSSPAPLNQYRALQVTFPS